MSNSQDRFDDLVYVFGKLKKSSPYDSKFVEPILEKINDKLKDGIDFDSLNSIGEEEAKMTSEFPKIYLDWPEWRRFITLLFCLLDSIEISRTGKSIVDDFVKTNLQK